MKLISIFFVILSVVPVAQAMDSDQAPPRLAVVGDSLAFGFGATDWFLTPGECIKSHFQITEMKNFSRLGATSEDIIKRLEDVIAWKPDWVFLSSGGNDAIIGALKTYPESKTLQESEEIFDRLQQAGIFVIYLGLQPPYLHSERLPKIWALAQSKGILVVDGLQGLWANPQYMVDSFHPNDVGYSLMCDRVVKSLKTFAPLPL